MEMACHFIKERKKFTDKYVGYPTAWTTKIAKSPTGGGILISARPPVGPTNFATEKICIGKVVDSNTINK
jgi:type I restriction enzyme S subunit